MAGMAASDSPAIPELKQRHPWAVQVKSLTRAARRNVACRNVRETEIALERDGYVASTLGAGAF
jgi:hypothetical protein